jgi:hypothetical protein
MLSVGFEAIVSGYTKEVFVDKLLQMAPQECLDTFRGVISQRQPAEIQEIRQLIVAAKPPLNEESRAYLLSHLS